MQDNLWAVVLAGGEEHRNRLIRSWLRCPRPKQYCTFLGTRSMLRHTVDRTSRVVNPNRIVTIIGEGHLTHVWESVGQGMPGRIVQQPVSRGTAAAVFLAATYVLAANPEATFVILPSDHFVYPESLFVEELKELIRRARILENRLILLGVKPDYPEQEYGWIEAGSEQGERLKEVQGFWEKPSPSQAREFLRRGYLWNTMVMAVKGQLLWSLGESIFPVMMAKLEELRTALEAVYGGRIQGRGTEIHLSLLPRIFADLPTGDFSTELLQRACDQTLVFEMDDRVLWSDWGSPHRVCKSLEQIRKSTRFCQHLARKRSIFSAGSPVRSGYRLTSAWTFKGAPRQR
jgi:mannose-1-phosphate guanylyltransferase